MCKGKSMPTKSFKKGFLASSIAMILTGTSVQVMAAEEAKINKDETEVIEVTGLRGSNKQNLNNKRFANSVVDSITAEDIGKFPDKNVAESLSRISGVSITRDFGEGEKISVRGTDPTKNRTLLNGQNVASADWFVLDEPTRSFNYTLLPSQIVSNLEVYKSPTASLDEGSIGGTVVLHTRKPFDLDTNTLYASVEAQYSDLSEETDPQISGLYSWKNEDENFGVLVSYVNQKRTLRRDGYEVLGWGNEWDSAADPTVPAEVDGAKIPGILGNAYFTQERERETFMAAVQWAPTDELDMTLNYLNSELEANNTNYNLLHVPKWNRDTGWRGNGGYTVVPGSTNVQDGAQLGGSFSGAATNTTAYNVIDRIAGSETESIDLDTRYTADHFSLTFQIGTTEASGGTERDRLYEFAANADYTYDVSNGSIDISHESDFAPGQPDAYALGWVQGADKPQTDEETYAQLDLEIPVELGAFDALKFGMKYRDHEKAQTFVAHRWHIESAGVDLDGDGNIGTGLDEIVGLYPNYGSLESGHTPSNHQDGLGGYSQGYALIDLNKANAALDAAHTTELDLLDGFYTVSEKILAGYAQADFSGDGFRGNLGMSVVQTDADISVWDYSGNWWDDANQGCNGFSTDCTRNWNTDNKTTTDVLPSLNVAFDLDSDTILRAAFYRSMARPDYSAMAPRINANEDTGLAVRGNADLESQYANSFDLGYEWYYSDSSMVGATYFFKDISSYTTYSPKVITRIDEETGQPISIVENTILNGPGGTTQGVEFIWQHSFDNGFGYVTNYTYTDAGNDGERDLDIAGSGLVKGASEHMVNLMGYYENDVISARAMYNYRSEWYDGVTDFGSEQFTEAFGQVDLSVTWMATDYLDVKFEAVNVTDETIHKYHQVEDRFSKSYANGRRLVVGASIKF